MKKTKIYLFTAIGMTAATMIVGAAALLTGCSHDNPTVAPAGWGRIGEPFDSLSRKLELALIGDAGADSIARLAGRFADAAKRDIAKKEARRRAHYWLGRAAARQGDSARSTRELEAALAGPDDSEGEYLRRRITWLREEMEDYTRPEWYRHLREDADYYSRRHDAIMLYDRYIALMNLMRDVGYRARAIGYLASADSCAAEIRSHLPFPGSVINNACVLHDLGKKDEAADIFSRLREDPAAMSDPDIKTLVYYNLYALRNDTAALRIAYDNLSADPGSLSLMPLVAAQRARLALDCGDTAGAAGYATVAAEGADELGQSDHRLMALRTVAEVRAACGDSDGAAGAYRRYVEAADSVLSAMRDNEVVNLEVMSQIEVADAEFAKRETDRRRRSLVMIIASAVIAVAGVAAGIARLRRADRMRREAEHRQMALQIAGDRKQEVLTEAIGTLESISNEGAIDAVESRRLLRLLREGESKGIASATFNELISQIHPEFISRLRRHAPALSDAAVRLACYTAIGLDTKEIAKAMNVRPESVKQARWRLRRQLALPAGTDLADFLRGLM